MAIPDSANVRRTLLESARDSISFLQEFEKMEKIRNEKRKALQELRGSMREIHELIHRAVNNLLRRKILCVLNDGDATFEDLVAKTCMDKITLEWHLSVLESGFCIEKENKQGCIIYKLTQTGKVVNYI